MVANFSASEPAPGDPPAERAVKPDAVALAHSIGRGELSAEDVCKSYLDRIAELDAELNAFVHVFGRRALRQASRAERGRRFGATSPLFGVPIAIKDAHAIRGSFMRLGSRSTERLLTPIDDVLIRRLRQAGLVFLGKTNMSEFGLLPTTEPSAHRPTRNPHDPKLSPGGSSGGSAAAVAAGLAPIAIGSDGGGSIRIPAAFCGIFGFKPSRGLVTNPFGQDSKRLMWICGPLSRSVRDAAALMDALVDPGPKWRARAFAALQRRRSGRELAEPPPCFESGLQTPPTGLKIRYTSDFPLGKTAPSVVTAVERVARALSDLGHDVSEGPELRGSTSVAEFLPLWQANAAQVPLSSRQRVEPFTAWLTEHGRRLDPREVGALSDRIAARVTGWFGDADVWVTPTVAVDPPPIGAWRDLSPPEVFEAAAKLAAFTAVFNVTGQPAASLPVGLSPSGLPIGVQLVARAGRDVQLMALAGALENAMRLKPPRPVTGT